jgi:hypothetical protein
VGEELTMIDGRMAIALAMLAPLGAGTAQEMMALEGDVAPVHDPVVIKEKNGEFLTSWPSCKKLPRISSLPI